MSAPPAPATRVTSVDALRGFVMFMMIFVNDLAGAGDLVPDWMVHFSERHRSGSGMTFVDLVFPAFLFIVGMSIPLALGAQLRRGISVGRVLLHVISRTLCLLLVGVLMVNELPDAARSGWPPALWATLMYLSAIAAFCDLPGEGPRRVLTLILRVLGFAGLFALAAVFVGADGHRIVTWAPFSLHTEWWGILGLIGWAYLAGAIVFLVFRARQTALAVCMVLLLCQYAADRAGAYDGFWLAHVVGLGEALGSQAAITVGGLLLATATILRPNGDNAARVRFTVLFAAATSAGALLVNGLYGISKNSATPSWCLWACTVTALLWLAMHYLTDVHPVPAVARPLTAAGRNVLLAYLLSEMLPSLLDLLHLGGWYGHLAEAGLFAAIARSLACGVVVLVASTGLNRIGFRLKL